MSDSAKPAFRQVFFALCTGFIAVGVLFLAARPTSSVRDRFRQFSSDALGVTEPIRITAIIHWEDVGSVGISFSDSAGKYFLSCLDGRTLEDKYAHLYIGAIHPTKPGAKAVALGGLEEAALYGLLIR